MVSIPRCVAHVPCRTARGRRAMASTAPERRVCAEWTSGQARSHPARHRRGASLGSQGLRAWGSPSVGRGTPIPGGEHGVPRLGCSTANGKAARWRAGWHAQEEDPGSLRTGPSLDADVSQREAMASTACRSPLDPRVARLGTQISLTAERNTRPWAWPDPTEAGDPQGR
jgi:hypothetical protein